MRMTAIVPPHTELPMAEIEAPQQTPGVSEGTAGREGKGRSGDTSFDWGYTATS